MPRQKQSRNKPTGKNRHICYCNNVSQEIIEQAIQRGCNTLPKVFDATTAGVGACGGSCRPYLQKMLDSWLKNKTFPDNPRPKRNK